LGGSTSDEACIVTSVAAVTLDHLILNGELLVEACPPSLFHNLLGPPSRIVAAGPPAPYGHRNNQIHVYDSLGIFLNEHHHTYAIEAVSFVLWPEESHFALLSPFSRRLALGSLHVAVGFDERHLSESGLPLWQMVAGSWNAKGQVYVSVETKGRRLPSGRRSKARSVATISVGLRHDPWNAKWRPKSEAKS
jgi:hypothetical protein